MSSPKERPQLLGRPRGVKQFDAGAEGGGGVGWNGNPKTGPLPRQTVWKMVLVRPGSLGKDGEPFILKAKLITFKKEIPISCYITYKV